MILESIGEATAALGVLERLTLKPAVNAIPLVLRFAGILRDLGRADESDDVLTAWLSALGGASAASVAPIRAALGIHDEAQQTVPLAPGLGKRIAIIGGSATSKRFGLEELERLGFRDKDVRWLDADDGQKLSYSDCKDVVDGTFDYYVIVTNYIGHDTSRPVVADLKRRRKCWRPLEVRGKKGFRDEIGRLLAELAA